MEEKFVYKTKGVCSKEIHVTYDKDSHKIIRVQVVRGCPGNTQGVAALLEGMSLEDAAKRLKGIRCPGSEDGNTSCPDQISHALEEIVASLN